MTSAQCALCKDIINSKLGFIRCECGTIAVDDGRYLAIDFDYVLEVKDDL
jgi:hypothetical protein